MSNRNTNGPLRIIRVTPRDQTVAWLKRWAGNSAIGFSFVVSHVIAVLALVSAVLVFTAAGRLLVWWAHTPTNRGSTSNRNIPGGQKLLYLRHRVLTEVEDTGGEDCIGFSFEQYLGHVLQCSGASAGHDRHAHCLAYAARDFEIEPRLRPIRIDAVQDDLARPERNRAPRPFHSLHAGRLAAALRENFPSIRSDLLCVDRYDNTLTAEFFRPGANQIGRRDRRRIDADFVRACLEHRMHVGNRANAPADGQWHETLVGRALDDIDDGGAPVRAGRDVEEHHFISALFVVADGQFDGIADVAQFAGFGAPELHAPRYLAAVNIKARNDSAS
jgi:hypothetical protein